MSDRVLAAALTVGDYAMAAHRLAGLRSDFADDPARLINLMNVCAAICKREAAGFAPDTVL